MIDAGTVGLPEKLEASDKAEDAAEETALETSEAADETIPDRSPVVVAVPVAEVDGEPEPDTESVAEADGKAESVAVSVEDGDSRAADDGEKIGIGRMPVPEGLAVETGTVALPAVSVDSVVVGSGSMPVRDCRMPVSLSVVLVLALAPAVVLAEVASGAVAESVTAGDDVVDTVLSVMMVDSPISVRPDEVPLLDGAAVADALSPVLVLGTVGATSDVGPKKPVPAEPRRPVRPFPEAGLSVAIAELEESVAEREDSEAGREEIVDRESDAVGGTMTGGRPLFEAPKIDARGTSMTVLLLDEVPAVGCTSLLGPGPPVDPKTGRAGWTLPWEPPAVG